MAATIFRSPPPSCSTKPLLGRRGGRSRSKRPPTGHYITHVLAVFQPDDSIRVYVVAMAANGECAGPARCSREEKRGHDGAARDPDPAATAANDLHYGFCGTLVQKRARLRLTWVQKGGRDGGSGPRWSRSLTAGIPRPSAWKCRNACAPMRSRGRSRCAMLGLAGDREPAPNRSRRSRLRARAPAGVCDEGMSRNRRSGADPRWASASGASSRSRVTAGPEGRLCQDGAQACWRGRAPNSVRLARGKASVGAPTPPAVHALAGWYQTVARRTGAPPLSLGGCTANHVAAGIVSAAAAPDATMPERPRPRGGRIDAATALILLTREGGAKRGYTVRITVAGGLAPGGPPTIFVDRASGH